MATVTQAAAAVWSTTGGTQTLTATPASSDLIVVVAATSGIAAGTTAVSDNNSDGLGTYTKISGTDFTGFSTTGHLNIWVRNALVGSATSTVFTATQASSTGGGLDVYRISGMVRTGTSAVRGSGGQSTGTAATTPAPVLTGAALTTNPVISAVCNGTSPGGVTVRGTPSYTRPTNLGYATPTAGLDVMYISSGETSGTITWGGTSATAFASMAVELDSSDLPYSGGPQGWSSPAGIRAVYVRTGLAMASQIPLPSAVTPVTPAPFYPKNCPVRARLPQPQFFPRGRTAGSKGAPLQNPQPGPAFRQAAQPIRARVPQNAPRGRTSGNPGTLVVRPSVTGPPLHPQGLIRAALPQQPVLRGRNASNAGAPLRNPAPGPVFTQAVTPARARIPQVFSRGRVYSSPGGPLRNPQPGPVFRQKPFPVQARFRGIPRGRMASAWGFPPGVPQAIPPSPLTSPVSIRHGLPPRGRTSSNPGAPVRNPQPGPVFRQAVRPAQPRFPQLQPRAGRVYSSPGSPLRNPAPGPVFVQAVTPARARIPQVFSRGRVYSNPGGPLRNPQPGPVFYQAVRPAQARIPQVFSKGRVYRNAGAPVQNPQPGPAFRQATAPARIRPALPPRGRIGSNPGGPVVNPVVGPGPVFFPFRHPVQARIPQNGPRGRVYRNAGGPVRNPQPGPVFTQAVRPVQARRPLPPKGRIGSNPGGPVVNPAPPGFGPVFYQRNSAAPRQTLPRRGVTRAIRFYPATANPQPGPVVYPLTGPVRARLPQQPLLRGRAASNPGGPVQNPVTGTGPVFVPFRAPVRVHPSLPPRGRTASSPGGPVRNPVVSQGPPFYPRGPVRARLPLPRRGVCRAIRFYPLPVNPPGPVAPLYPLTGPVRAPLPPLHPAAGRIRSSPGGPVANPSAPVAPSWALTQPAGIRVVYLATGRGWSTPAHAAAGNPRLSLRFRYGSPYFQWAAEEPCFPWDAGDPGFRWETGEPYLDWE